MPERNLATTFSATSAFASGAPTSKSASDKLPRRMVGLWHFWQYCLTTPLSSAGAIRATGGDLGAPARRATGRGNTG